MDSKARTLVISVIIAAILLVLGAFVFGHTLGIITVFLSILIVGLASGNMMDTPCQTSGKKYYSSQTSGIEHHRKVVVFGNIPGGNFLPKARLSISIAILLLHADAISATATCRAATSPPRPAKAASAWADSSRGAVRRAAGHQYSSI